MKKFLMSVLAMLGLVSMPVAAQEPALQLGIEGNIAAYAAYLKTNDSNVRKFDFRKYAQVELHGETVLDNGITAGVEIKMLMDREDSQGGEMIEESFVYLSSQYGRVNFGEAHGAAYLLQVAVPAVDENIDGLKPHISTTGAGVWGSYANRETGEHNKLTYFTPVFNGFQVGVSYTPSLQDVSGTQAAMLRNTLGEDENGWEGAVRYEGAFGDVDVTLGAGYAHISPEVKLGNIDAIKVVNASGVVGFKDINFGLGYTHNNQGLTGKNDMKVWAAGANYSFDAMRVGVSYRHITGEREVLGLADVKTNRWTTGGVYTWGPGLSTRAALQYSNVNDAGDKSDHYQFTLGTQVNF